MTHSQKCCKSDGPHFSLIYLFFYLLLPYSRPTQRYFSSSFENRFFSSSTLFTSFAHFQVLSLRKKFLISHRKLSSSIPMPNQGQLGPKMPYQLACIRIMNDSPQRRRKSKICKRYTQEEMKRTRQTRHKIMPCVQRH